MNLLPIKIECHSGYKADEYPVCFYLENVKCEIKEITDRWYQTDPSPGLPVADYFKVRIAGNLEYIIKHELFSDKWFLVTMDQPDIRFSCN